MNIIKLSAKGNRLTTVSDSVTTGGSVNYDICEFTFDNEWNNLTKTAVFSFNNDESVSVVIENNHCAIPAICTEKEGLLKIGVFGIGINNMILTTNAVAHRIIDGVYSDTPCSTEDYELVQNTVEKLTMQIENFKAETNAKCNELLKSLQNKIDATSPEIDYIDDWYIPTPVTDAGLAPIVSGGATFGDFFDFKLNPLAEEFPEYVSITDIGRDESEIYHTYAYIFTPENYTKSILITAGVHGNERVAFHALAYFLDRLCRDKTNKILKYIRQNIKLYVVPAVNPYGLANAETYNINGVDIGYNFPYNWQSSSKTEKGSSPADQKETQNIINFVNSILSDKLCAAIDLHTSSFPNSSRMVAYPRNHSNCVTALADMVNCFNFDEASVGLTNRAILTPSANPTLTNHLADTFDINTCELIWNNNLYGGIFSNVCMTKYVEFIGNGIYTMARNSRITKKAFPQPFTKYFSWNSSSSADKFSISNTSEMSVMGISNYSLSLNSPCNITASGTVTLNVTNECTVRINPVLYQINSSEQDYSNRINSETFTQKIKLTPGSYIIPLNSVLQAYFTSYNHSDDCAYCEDVLFSLAFSATVSNAVSVTGFSFTLNAIPSDLAKPVEITRPMGNAADYSSTDIPVQAVIYPLETYSQYDETFSD